MTEVSDSMVVLLLKKCMETFPTFGYRRLTACVNRLLADEGKPSINHKRVFRLLQSEGLMFPKPQSRLPGASRNHDGRVAVDKSNKRWCSDGLEFRCNNGQKVTMTFVLDCCDREIISFVARTGRGLPSWMVQKAVSAAVERRFGSETAVPKGLQFLTDNGSAYVSASTKFLLRCLGIENCKTAVCSPQSNGMAESLVKTLKRDYLPFIDLSKPESAMAGLAAAVAKYNALHPHSALGYLSPKEYRQLKGEKDFEGQKTIPSVVDVPGYLINVRDRLCYPA